MVLEIIAAHSILVKIFLGFLVAGIFIPMMTSRNGFGFKKASFIYTMIFQALATMVAFAGFVALFVGELNWNISTVIMVVIWVVMMYIEIKKYKLIKMANIENRQTHKVLKEAFVKISIVQVLLVSVMIVLMILKAKGIVTL